MKAARLPDRGVIKLGGKDARKFLNGLVTTDITNVTEQSPRFAALLTPQGKIIVDFIVASGDSPDDQELYLDCPKALAATLLERLAFYKLRAKIEVEDFSDILCILALWDDPAPGRWGLRYPDPRLPALGWRCISAPDPANAAAFGADLVDARDYEAHRIALGVPSGGLDFIYGDTFPHEADMDQLGGVDFDKGCFVGQEVVSRMEHRGTARTRVVPVTLSGVAPPVGSASTGSGRRSRAACRCARERRSYNSSSRLGRALRFPAKQRLPNEHCAYASRWALPLSMGAPGPALRRLPR
jgi:tRNA-modifying protein YgfZ